MATKAKAKAKKTAKKVDTKSFNAVDALRKGTLAYVGLYGMAYERAQTRFTQLRETTDGLFDTLVERGEKIEAQANDAFKGTRETVAKRYAEGSEKVRSVLPTAAKSRVAELEGEIASLNKKIVSMSKKARPSKAAAKAKMKTTKTAKAA